MAGKKCPECGKFTFFINGNIGECSNCGCKLKVPAKDGKGGKGKKCPMCDKYTLHDGICSNCGARK